MNRVAKQYVLPYLWITLASAVYAVGFNWCYEPNQIGFGGITGVGQIINHILPWAPIGTVVILSLIHILMEKKTIEKDGKRRIEYRYFISSLKADIEQISRAVLSLIHIWTPARAESGN